MGWPAAIAICVCFVAFFVFLLVVETGRWPWEKK